MKIHILFEFVDGPWGGGNQFLKALKKELQKRGVHTANLKEADCVLFNSFQNIKRVLIQKLRFPRKLFIHRVDGPIFGIRGQDLAIDQKIYRLNNLLADGSIFISQWCQQQNHQLGLINQQFEQSILNAPDPEFFNTHNRKQFQKNKKIKLIAVCWSGNYRKGFAAYQYLDNNLDFNKYEMTFIGQSPVKFNRITQLSPVPSNQLGLILKQHDIFITASQKDPCPNSLAEALHCGLPALALNDGGHPELIKNSGELFSSNKELLAKLERVANNYLFYQRQISVANISQVTDQYYGFIEKIFQKYQSGLYQIKKIKIFPAIKIILSQL